MEYLGFPLRLDINQPDVSEPQAREIIASLDNACKSVLITYQDKTADIIELLDFLGTNSIQIHGPIDLSQLSQLREQKEKLVIKKSLVVGKTEEKNLIRDLEKYSPYVDAFITDTYDPETGASGETGKTHDWEISRRLVELSSRPVILAGGLTHENVAKAILKVRPAGVDAHTGVEGTDGCKDPRLVELFITEARSAFRALD